MFYKYLTKNLRGNSETLGVYPLVCRNTPLSDLKWEHLQFESNKLLYPLSEHQFQILLAIYKFINEGGIDVLNPRAIRAAIISQVPFQPNVKPSTELSRFFKFIDGSWYLRFHSPAFGLDRLFFQFEIKEGRSLLEIINFHDPNSTVLGLSAVYYDRNNRNSHIGTLVIPTQTINHLTAYFHHREAEGDLSLIELTKIHSIHRNVSFENYKAGTGWLPINKTKRKRLTNQIKVKQPRKKNRSPSMSFTTPNYNTDWNFRDHPLPSQIIKLYCKFSREFSFSSLPITFSHSEIGLLKQLLYNQVVHVGFVPYQLVHEFAIDPYWIKIPKIPEIQLTTFLNTLPHCEYYITDSFILVWTRLDSKLRQWIKDDLKWEIYQILPTYPPQGLKYKWFDQNNLVWIQPDFS